MAFTDNTTKVTLMPSPSFNRPILKNKNTPLKPVPKIKLKGATDPLVEALEASEKELVSVRVRAQRLGAGVFFGSGTNTSIKGFCKVLGLSHYKVLEDLRHRGYLQAGNQATNVVKEEGYMVTLPVRTSFQIGVTPQVFLTPKGCLWLFGLLQSGG